MKWQDERFEGIPDHTLRWILPSMATAGCYECGWQSGDMPSAEADAVMHAHQCPPRCARCDHHITEHDEGWAGQPSCRHPMSHLPENAAYLITPRENRDDNAGWQVGEKVNVYPVVTKVLTPCGCNAPTIYRDDTPTEDA